MKILIDAINHKINDAAVFEEGQYIPIPFAPIDCPYDYEDFVEVIGKQLQRTSNDFPFEDYWDVLWMVEVICLPEDRPFVEKICNKNIKCITVNDILLEYCLNQKKTGFLNVAVSFDGEDKYFLVDIKSKGVFSFNEKTDSIPVDTFTPIHIFLSALKQWYIEYASWTEKDRSNYLIKKGNNWGIKTYIEKARNYTVLFDTEGDYYNLLLHCAQGRKFVVFYDQCFFESNYSSITVKAQLDRIIKEDKCAGAFPVITSKNGDEAKELNQVLKICEELNAVSVDRNMIVVAIGGGVLLDLAGMAAAMYKRGIHFIKIPTTMIGQIDAGIGIKVGCNYNGTQNLLGAFYPAEYVINSFPFLEMQSVDKIKCGMAEVLKTAMIGDLILLEKMKHYVASNSGGEDMKYSLNGELCSIVNYAAVAALNMLKDDQYEKNAARRLCDFGHSFSGMLKGVNGRRIHHGYAVALEILFSIEFARKTTILNDNTYKEYIELIRALQIINKEDLLSFKFFSCSDFYEFVNAAMKKRGGDFNFLIPTGRGKVGFVNFNECHSKENYTLLIDQKEFQDLFFEIVNDICMTFN